MKTSSIVSSTPSFDEQVATIRDWLTGKPESARLWDLLTCLRGPDNPSEKDGMSSEEHAKAYRGRRERKRKTVEVIRGISGLKGGAARNRNDIKYVTVNKNRDHFDRHVEAAARALKLEVRYE